MQDYLKMAKAIMLKFGEVLCYRTFGTYHIWTLIEICVLLATCLIERERREELVFWWRDFSWEFCFVKFIILVCMFGSYVEELFVHIVNTYIQLLFLILLLGSK